MPKRETKSTKPRPVKSRTSRAELKAEGRIKVAAGAKSTALDLTSLDLTEVPESICRLTDLEFLNLSGNHLTTLPDFIGQLRHLRRISLSNNSLVTLPDSIGQLERLQNLDVSSNNLRSLTNLIHRLGELQNLNISENALTSLPESVAQLEGLLQLDASNNRLSALPLGVGRLWRLRRLILFANQIEVLPNAFARLTQLETLSLSLNPIMSLPDTLSSLGSLRSLALGGTRIQVLPECVADLTALEYLVLGGSRLEKLPEWIGTMRSLKGIDLSNAEHTILNWEDKATTWQTIVSSPVEAEGIRDLPESMRQLPELKELYLHGNKSLNIPTEILGGDWDAARRGTEGKRHGDPAKILEYYFRTRRGKRPLNEAKVILVGRGGVGKTCLIKRLIQKTFDQAERETPGIEIRSWPITLPDGEEVRLHVWDFGGQEILHATHQFFLTERTLYLLVLSGREGNPTHDAEYWLQLIRSFGGQSRVIVALNKANQHTFDVNRGLLLEKYPFIADFVKTDCEDASGVPELEQLIVRETESLEHRKVAFPADWFTIKERLAGMEESFVTWDKYQEICSDLGEIDSEAQRDLAQYLHILGIALNYRDDPRLRDTHVLNPRWVTEGIYALLRAGQRPRQDGVINGLDLASVLDSTRYPRSCHDFLLRLMEKFQLCFALPGNGDRYLVPELLGESQPDLRALLEAPGLAFRYQYEVLPEGVLPRFIVQTHRHSEAHAHWRWRTGVVLERDGCLAVVRADGRERRVDIHVTGQEGQRRGLLAIIRDKFDEQHRDLRGLAVDERVPVPGVKDVTISYRHLLELEEDGEVEYRPEGLRKAVSIADLLNGVESAESRLLRRQSTRTAVRPKADGAGIAEIRENRKPERPTKKCKLLFLTANPSGTTPLALDEESREIDQKIRASHYRDELEQVTKWAVRADDLLQFLNEYQPDVVHFSGHGSPTEELVLLDSRKEPKSVSKQALRQLFETLKDNVRVVVLNACFSRPQAAAITEIVDCAIGMKRAIGDEAAIVFAAAFYRAIGFGRSVGEAFEQGKAALMLEGIPEESTPELLVRKGVVASEVFLLKGD